MKPAASSGWKFNQANHPAISVSGWTLGFSYPRQVNALSRSDVAFSVCARAPIAIDADRFCGLMPHDVSHAGGAFSGCFQN